MVRIGPGVPESRRERRASPVRVLVVDDVAEVREGLARLLDRLDGVQVIGTAADGHDALALVAEQRPQVVLMDLRMPLMDGVAATRLIGERHPEVAVLMLSAYGDESLVVEALMAGARGYLLKGTGVAQLAEAVVGAATGQSHLSGQVTRPLLERLVDALRREQETRKAAEEARQASELLAERQRQFATMAAHELRTPVTALLGSLVLLQRLTGVRLGETERDMLVAAIRQARWLARLGEDLTVVAQASAGGLSISARRVYLAQALREAVEDLRHLGAAERARLDAPEGLRAWADPDRLAQVLANLVRNALQHTPPGSPVEIAAAREGTTARIVVADRGPGIPPEKLPTLFERYGSRPPGGMGGLGVGLWVVRELLHAMDGEVAAADRPGGGASFTVTLPLATGRR